jgi:membrane fusion protein (multidrug efflux system)
MMTKNDSLGRVLGAVFLFGVISGCKEEEAPPVFIPDVEVVAVRQETVPEIKEWIGVLDGSVNAQIQAQVRGYLLKQLYREGSFVKAGQPMFEIDPRPFEAALSQARSEVGKAEAEKVRADANLKRAQDLIKKDAISQMEFDDATEKAAVASANLQSALANLETAKINLGFTSIVSPISGVAGMANAQVGDLVGGGETKILTTVSTLDPIKVLFVISEQEYLQAADEIAAALKKKRREDVPATLDLILADGSTYPMKGTFDFIDRQVDPSTGTIKAAALFPNPDNVLRPGSYGRVRAAVNEVPDAILVPQKAVRELQGDTQVVVVNAASQAEIRSVKTGFRYGDMWIISEGLRPGERVVVEGLQKVVRDGPVKIVGGSAKQPPTAPVPARPEESPAS